MLARYFLFSAGSYWMVTLEGQIVGRYPSRTEAVEAAIVMADLMGAMHHDADVMVAGHDALELVWSLGADRNAPRARRSGGAPQPDRHHLVQVQHGTQRA